MTIGKTIKEISSISDDESINIKNYIASLEYLENLYNLIIFLRPYISLKNVTFLPSFKSNKLVKEFGLPCTTEENELRFFKIKSSVFLEDYRLISEIEAKAKILNLYAECIDGILYIRIYK